MNYRHYLPDTPSISEIGLGAWQLAENSGWKSMSEAEATALVHKALQLGINFFDTAPNYGHGSGETRLGNALRGVDRDTIVINTKFGHTDAGTMNYESDHIRESLEGSLRRLQVDYVDSLIIHNPPSRYLDGTQNDHYEILERLKEEGKIKTYGASLDTYDDMKLFLDTTEGQVIEAFFNILWQDSARAFPQAKEQEVSIIAKVPLDSGWLTGKYQAESTFHDIRERWSREDIHTRARLVDQIRQIIDPSANLPQVAIAFCLAYEAVSTVIPGAVSIQQLMTNVASAEQSLSADLRQKLEAFYQQEVKPLGLPW
jgi:aryl-alcohol dehydrogenase-like predicted oxidoreductase